MIPERPQHIHPGTDTTIDPTFFPDTLREKPGKKEPMYLISESRIKKVLELDRGAYDRSDEIDDLLRANKYSRPAPDCSQCRYKRFAANMANAEAHDARVRNEVLDKLVSRVCEEEQFLGMSIDNEEVYYLTGHHIRKIVESLRSEVKE